LDTTTTVGDLGLQTPLLLASGFITETADFFLRAKPFGCAGMVTRSLKKVTPPERTRVPAPRYAVIDGNSLICCEWGNENHWTTWRNQGVNLVKNAGGAIILSLSGRDVDGCCDLVETFDKVGVDAFEINISCPHSGVISDNLNVDCIHLQQLLGRVRSITTTPIWIKLSYSPFLVPMACEAESLGANAIVCTNSIGPGLLIDTATAKPKLGIKGGCGGLAGQAIFPIALWCVSQLSQAVTVPIVGCGGISSADHVLQMLMAGASAVQLYTTPALQGPRIFSTIMKGLQSFFADHAEYNSVSDLVGIATDQMAEHRFTSPRPVIIQERCTHCGRCADACPFGAIEKLSDRSPSIMEGCTSCNFCVGVCPSTAIRAVF